MKIKKITKLNFGYIKVKPTLNNIFITLTDIKGNVLISKHAGLIRFKGSKKRTPYVAGQVVKNLILSLNKLNIKVKLFILQIKGYIKGSNINNIIRQLEALNIKNIFYIEYLNIKNHNGLRLKKKRRL